jgi:hypothetical protein
MIVRMGSLTDFERGFLSGLIIGEGHFGVHRGRAHFVLGMHVRHEYLLRRVQDLLPGAILYGPYHWQGRDFFRLMVRGAALRSLLDILDALAIERWCPHVAARYAVMREVAATMRVAAPRRREPPVS